MDQRSGHSFFVTDEQRCLLSLLVFAALIRNTAARLAGALAGSLALAASAVCCTVLHAACIQCHNVLHSAFLLVYDSILS